VNSVDFSSNEGNELSAQITANAYIYGAGDAAATSAATATTPAPATTPPATATPPAGGTS
jgi:hypothetical protein